MCISPTPKASKGGPRLTEAARIENQLLLRQTRIGPDAAREIARKIEEQGGFWGPRKVGTTV